MHIYLHGHSEPYDSPAEYAKQEELAEGEEFELIAIDVIASNTYRIINGKPELVKTAVPTGIEVV
jgi:hypothetical protein